MGVIVRFLLLCLCLQAEFYLSEAGVEHLTLIDSKCFPYDFVFNLEEKQFVRLLIVPYLGHESLRDLSRLDVITDYNPRYNEFLSCMWKDRKFQMQNGTINFTAIEEALADAIGREVGSTGPGMQLSKIEAARIVSECNNLGGLTHGQRVVLVRNCILARIKKFDRI